MQSLRRARTIIAEDEVPRVFDADCIDKLVRICQLPANADQFLFGEAVREAALNFAREVRQPNVNEVHDEIAALAKAADPTKPPQWEAMATALEALSLRAREMLVYRGSRTGVVTPLPEPESLRDPERREGARAALIHLAVTGWEFKSRSRGGGKRSRPRLEPVAFAQKKGKSPPRYDAERKFVMRLQHAWFVATGKQAVQTARRREYVERACSSEILRDLGPFAQFIRECFRLVGAPEVDCVERMYEVHLFSMRLASNNP